MKIKYCLLIVFLFTVSVCLYAVKLSITIKYLGLNVVYVNMQDTGRELKISARSSALASIASDLDNHYSVVYHNDYLPITYAKIIEQGDYQERRIITYHREVAKAELNSFIDPDRDSEYPIHPEARDFFSALFYLGGNLQETGGTIWLDAGNLIWKADYEVIGNENIRTFKGRQKTILVKLAFTKISKSVQQRSDMLTNNLVSEENDLFIWYTDDAERIPVKAKFAMKPFSVVWKVTDYEK